MENKGLVVVLSAPSGAGKGTLLKVLRKNNENIRFSISATTRKPRAEDEEGVSYFFKSVDEFQYMIEKKQLLEWVVYCDNYYGTPKDYVVENIGKGYDIIIEIEVEGAMKVMEQYPDCVSIFIVPPSLKELRKRLEKRGSETTQTIEKRMNRAMKELTYADQYQYLLVNDEIEKAAMMIDKIISAEKHKFIRNQQTIHDLVKESLL